MDDGYEQTLSGLLRRRAELALEVEAHRASWEAASSSLEAIDRAILVFSPGLNYDDLPLRRRPPVARDGTTELQRFLLDMLRRSGGKVRTLTAASRLAAERGVDERDRVAMTLLRKRVADSFYRLRKKGMVTSVKFGSGSELEWRLKAGSETDDVADDDHRGEQRL